VPHTPVYNLKEVFDDPQVKHMGMQIAIERKEKPTIRTVKFPLSHSELHRLSFTAPELVKQRRVSEILGL